MTIGSIAEARAVALAKPRWITTRNSRQNAKDEHRGRILESEFRDDDVGKPDGALGLQRSQADAIPNRITVPHGIFGWASFQVMIPIPGRNITATAVIVVLVSNLWNTPSVAQNAAILRDTWALQCEIIQGLLVGKLLEPSLRRSVLRDRPDFPEQQEQPAPWLLLANVGEWELRSLIACAKRRSADRPEKYGAVR